MSVLRSVGYRSLYEKILLVYGFETEGEILSKVFTLPFGAFRGDFSQFPCLF